MVMPHDPFVPTPDSPEWAEKNRRYEHDTIYFDDMIAYVDKIIGRLEAKLKEKGVWENTLFIFTADNGTHPSVLTNTNYGIIKGGKGSTLNTGNHVPFIVTWPDKIKMNKVFHGVVDFTDILPTIADAAGINPSSYFTDGKSFINVLEGDTKRISKNEVFIHYTPRWGRFDHSRWVMDGEYKLYQDGRFYNTLNDPDESIEKEILTDQEKEIKQKFQEILSQKENEFPFKWNDGEFNPQK